MGKAGYPSTVIADDFFASIAIIEDLSSPQKRTFLFTPSLKSPRRQ
jgi:hypothetical protein